MEGSYDRTSQEGLQLQANLTIQQMLNCGVVTAFVTALIVGARFSVGLHCILDFTEEP